MVSLARSQSPASRRILICSVHTDCEPLREMLSLLLSRRHIKHCTFDSLRALLDYVGSLSDGEGELSLVVMVGPNLQSSDVDAIDGTLGRVRCPTALIVFHDSLGPEPASWSGTQVEPRLRSPIPPRFSELLRVVESFED